MPRILTIFLTMMFLLTGEAFALVKSSSTDVLFRLNELRDEKALSSSYEPAGLLNEGHRYRDRSTNTFLTRDPAGYIDGPNDYNYVRHNPWSAWDPLGLFAYSVPNHTGDIGYTGDAQGTANYLQGLQNTAFSHFSSLGSHLQQNPSLDNSSAIGHAYNNFVSDYRRYLQAFQSVQSQFASHQYGGNLFSRSLWDRKVSLRDRPFMHQEKFLELNPTTILKNES